MHTGILSFPSLAFLASLPAACTEAAVGVMVDPLKLRFDGNSSVDVRDACKMAVDLYVIIYLL